jgi:branched-chain amino acid transport system ATP-binding protein
MTSPLLELDNVTKRFGRVVIAEDLSFAVGSGEVVGIVGPNGAGKTSLFGLISGELAPGVGEVRFAGRTVTKLDPAARCRLGIGRTYQVPRPFGDMTVFENLLVAAQQGGGLRRRASYAAAVGALNRCGMTGQANLPAERLGLLQRKRLGLARALATQPTLLLLDEVAGGLTDPEVAQLVEIVRGVNAEGTAVIWIEHVVRALTATASRPGCWPSPRSARSSSAPRSPRRWPEDPSRRRRPRRGTGRPTGNGRHRNRVGSEGEWGGGRRTAAGGPRPGRAPRAAPGP